MFFLNINRDSHFLSLHVDQEAMGLKYWICVMAWKPVASWCKQVMVLGYVKLEDEAITIFRLV
jgi:hypothetical protein